MLLLLPISAFAEVNILVHLNIQDMNRSEQGVISAGGTFRWDHVDIDLSHGVKVFNVDKDVVWDQGPQSASLATIRVYPFSSTRLRPMFFYQHTSDIFRGPPFADDVNEPTIDFVGGGFTVVAKPRLEFDFMYGSKAIDCGYLDEEKTCTWEKGSVQIAMRWFWRNN